MKRLILFGFILSVLHSCTKDTYLWSEEVEGYVVGSFKCALVDISKHSPPRGYCILLADHADSTNIIMDFYTFTPLDRKINIPNKVYKNHCTNGGWGCGPQFFTDGYQRKYKIRFQYRHVSEYEKINFVCGPCTADRLTFPWNEYPEKTLSEIKKIDD